MTKLPDRLYILAGNKQEARDEAACRGLKRNEWAFVGSIHDIPNASPIRVLCCGSCETLPHYHLIVSILSGGYVHYPSGARRPLKVSYVS